MTHNLVFGKEGPTLQQQHWLNDKQVTHKKTSDGTCIHSN